MSRNIMVLISVDIPIGILSLVYYQLHDSSDSQSEIHPDIVGLDERFQNTSPEIIVVGSSVANKAIERAHPGDTATSTFNYPKGEYSTLVIDGSGLGEGEWNIELIHKDDVFVKESIPLRLEGEYSILLKNHLNGNIIQL